MTGSTEKSYTFLKKDASSIKVKYILLFYAPFNAHNYAIFQFASYLDHYTLIELVFPSITGQNFVFLFSFLVVDIRNVCLIFLMTKIIQLLKLCYSKTSLGFPGGSVGKESVCNARDPGLIPGLGRSPGEGNGSPLQYSCLENPMDSRAWWVIIHGDAKSQTH